MDQVAGRVWGHYTVSVQDLVGERVKVRAFDRVHGRTTFDVLEDAEERVWLRITDAEVPG